MWTVRTLQEMYNCQEIRSNRRRFLFPIVYARICRHGIAKYHGTLLENVGQFSLKLAPSFARMRRFLLQILPVDGCPFPTERTAGVRFPTTNVQSALRCGPYSTNSSSVLRVRARARIEGKVSHIELKKSLRLIPIK